MPRPTPSEVKTSLSGFGRQIANFNQSDDGRFINSSDLSAGYCDGVVLDWLRRVLQGGEPSFGESKIVGSNPDHAFLRKRQSQAARQSDAFLNWTSTKAHWQQQTRPMLDREAREWGAKKDAYLDLFDELEESLFSKLQTSAANITLNARELELISKLYQKNIGSVQNTDKMVAFYEQIPGKRDAAAAQLGITADMNKKLELKVHGQLRQKAWHNFSQNMDTSGKKRAFGGMSLVESGVTISNLSLADAVKVLIAGQEKMRNGRGVKISLGGQQGRNNFFHATGCHMTGQGKYRFLDPNYGMFEYDQWTQGIVKAIAYLYRDVYSWPDDDSVVAMPIASFDLQLEIFE